MDNITFYQPPSASTSQPRCLSDALRASIVSGGPIAPISVHQTVSKLGKWNEIWKDHMIKNRDISDPLLERDSDQHYRNDTVQEQGSLTSIRYSPNSNDNNNLPAMDELLSGIKTNNVSASADSNRDDDHNDGFLDIDEFLAGLPQNISTSMKLDSGGMAEEVDSGTCGGSPVNSNCSTVGSAQDPIIVGDDTSVDTESKTDHNSLDINLTVKSDSNFLHIVDDNLVDDNVFNLGTTLISNGLVADHRDDSNDNDNSIVDSTKFQLNSDRPRSNSPDHGSVMDQPSRLPVNTEITQGSASHVDLDITKEVEDKGTNVFAKGDDNNDADTRSAKRPRLFGAFSYNPVPNSNIWELKDGQHNSAHYLQLGPAVASIQQSDLMNDPLPRHVRRRSARNVRKRPRTRAPIGLASTTSIVPTILESTNLEEPQSRALIAAPGQEREMRDTDQEMVDSGSSDDSNDEDYRDMSNAAGSEIGGRPSSRERTRWTEDTEHNVEPPSTHSLDVSCQAIAATSSNSVQESEEIPVCGYLTLKTIESKVVYCLTFSQELLLEPGGTWQSRDIARSVSSSSERGSERSPVQERARSRPVRNSRFSPKDDELLVQLKGEGLSWDEISGHFPERSKAVLQVHYSTKLKRRSEMSKTVRKR